MRVMRSPPGCARAVELQALLAAEAEGLPFLIARDPDGAQRLSVLEAGDERLWLGRDSTCDVSLDGDTAVSRVHAEMVRVAGDWAIVDDGLSRNGTYVNGDRVTGRRRLQEGDRLRLGNTSILTFRAPKGEASGTSRADVLTIPELTAMQRKVLVALCRPLQEGRVPTVPATNQEIADELVLSIDGVKTHVRALFAKFAVEDLPQNQKRARLAQMAMRSGL
jgi:pSer/pThr/pTyr-binding forkhead associated (FHA) protein